MHVFFEKLCRFPVCFLTMWVSLVLVTPFPVTASGQTTVIAAEEGTGLLLARFHKKFKPKPPPLPPKAKIPVPPVLNLSVSKAKKVLRGLGFSSRIVGRKNSSIRGRHDTVARQKPAPGKLVNRGTRVNLTVYRYKKAAAPKKPRVKLPKVKMPRVTLPPVGKPPAGRPPVVQIPDFLKQRISRDKLRALAVPKALSLRSGKITAQKMEDRRGRPFAFAWDARGRAVDLQQLAQRRFQEIQRTRGKLGAKLHRALSRFQPNQQVEVRVFMRSDPQEEAGQSKMAGSAGVTSKGKATGKALKGQAFQQFRSKALQRLQTVRSRIGKVVNGARGRFSSKGYQVRFASKRAPILSVRLRANQVKQLSSDPGVQAVYLPPKMLPLLNKSRGAVQMNTVWNRGWKSSGVRLGVVEGNSVDRRHANLRGHLTTQQNCVGDHVTHVAGIMASRNSTYRGMGYRARIINGTKCSWNGGKLYEASDWAVDQGARVLNFSWGADSGRTADGSARDADALVYYDRVTVVVAAGNEGCPKSGKKDWDVMSPGTAYNIITVGNFDDKNTAGRGDDRMSNCSSYKNPISARGDRIKPEVSAPGTRIISTVVGNTNNHTSTASKSGTSMAAPHIAGIAGTLMERWPRLKFRPEAVKAIMMAAATNNIHGGSRLSTKDGAGGINARRAHSNMHWWSWQGNWFGANRKYKFSLGTLRKNQRARVALVWSTWPNFPLYSLMPSIDMDLTVYDPNGRRVAVSSSWDNTYEIVQFTPNKTGKYRAEIKVFRWSGGRYKFGAALVRNVKTE